MEDNFGTKAKGKVGGFESLPERATGALPQAAVEVCEIQNEPVASSKSAAIPQMRQSQRPEAMTFLRVNTSRISRDKACRRTAFRKERS